MPTHFGSALIGGAACWLTVFLLLPKPMLVYVFGHELTHAVWTWLCGGRVKRFKASASGGHVILTKSNFLIALAPYFFPLYAVLVILIFVVGHLIWNWQHLPPVVSFFNRRSLRVSYHAHVAHFANAAIGHHRPGLYLFRGRDLAGEHSRAAHRHSAAHGAGQSARHFRRGGSTARPRCFIGWHGCSHNVPLAFSRPPVRQQDADGTLVSFSFVHSNCDG